MSEAVTRELTAYVTGIGVRGPGLLDWPQTEAVLRELRPYERADTLLPAPETLPPTERRRAGRVVRLAFAIGLEAARQSDTDPARLPVVFASSGGDGDNCHEICQTLASANRALSPTRFHNSVHNAPAGYWSIAAATQVPSTTVCAYDASFTAGLLEALTQLAVGGGTTALIAYDLDYPPPLRAARTVPAAFGLALVLHASPQPHALALLRVRLDTQAADCVKHRELESLRAVIPAAQGLVLLQAIAKRRATTVNIAYLEPQTLRVEVTPCA
ncbi:MAG TPA: beta-ketoacyl synthase chain length factor [Steroidobacteraceae bacterium]|nr:beta-ketoacyl synthase chain length factor [Steroidobacteraceae bacterium]